jgi:hypothetical protein
MQVASLRHTPPFDRLYLFLSKWTPKFDRVLVVESGARSAAERLLAKLYASGETVQVDVLTCQAQAPLTFDHSRGRVFFTRDAPDGPSRSRLFRHFIRERYSVMCVLFTGDDLMTPWKWAAIARVPAKVLIVNELADTFWLDRANLQNIRRMMYHRFGTPHAALTRLTVHNVVLLVSLFILVEFYVRMHLMRWWRERRARHNDAGRAVENRLERYNHNV